MSTEKNKNFFVRKIKKQGGQFFKNFLLTFLEKSLADAEFFKDYIQKIFGIDFTEQFSQGVERLFEV